MQPVNPKLRPVRTNLIEHQGRPAILLRDPLNLTDRLLVVPQELGALLAMCDGTRDAAGLRAAFLLHSGINLPIDSVRNVIEQLDAVFMLENDRYATALQSALREYRSLPSRRPASAGLSYPADPAELRNYLDAFQSAARQKGNPIALNADLRGLICPHIDYARGGPTYAVTWEVAIDAARNAERVIIFGTDHMGGDGKLTLTRQSYATPWGPLPADLEVIDQVARCLGEDRAFEEELHHVGEHSIELAAVWLHHVREGKPCPLVPILCGSFDTFVNGGNDVSLHPPFVGALPLLRQVAAMPRTLIIAAADLAHVGPAFGDAMPLDYVAQLRLEMRDARLIDQACTGRPDAFLAEIRGVKDRYHVCGLPPIYLTLATLGQSSGRRLAYDQCPAEGEGSWVSIAGVALV